MRGLLGWAAELLLGARGHKMATHVPKRRLTFMEGVSRGKSIGYSITFLQRTL
jgi:hypothetical protein